MVLASVLAHAAAPVVAQDTDDDARRPTLTRPIVDFLAKQGQHLTMGFVPEFLSFTAYFNPDDGMNRPASIDYETTKEDSSLDRGQIIKSNDDLFRRGRADAACAD